MRNQLLFCMSVLCMLAVSCIKDKPAPDRTYIPLHAVIVPPPVNDTAASKSYLALGDFYTIGQSVLVADRFPV